MSKTCIPADSENRRRFLATAFATGLGLTVSPVAVMAHKDDPAFSCKLTVAEALAPLLSMLMDAISEAFADLAGPLLAANKKCGDALAQLHGKFRQLEIELSRSAKTGETRIIQNFVEVGKANTEVIMGTLGAQSHHAVYQNSRLSKVTEHFANQAEGTLPQGNPALTKKAKEILMEIISLVHNTSDVPRKTQEANDEYQQAVTKIRKQFDLVRDHMFNFAEAAFHAEHAGTEGEASAYRTDADKYLTRAIELVHITGGPNRHRSEVESAVANLLDALNGARLWLANPLSPKGPVKKAHSRTSRAVILNEESIRATLFEPPDGVSEGLTHCPPASWWRVGFCYGAWGVAWANHPSDVGKRRRLLRSELKYFQCKDPQSNKEALITSLAGG